MLQALTKFVETVFAAIVLHDCIYYLFKIKFYAC